MCKGSPSEELKVLCCSGGVRHKSMPMMLCQHCGTVRCEAMCRGVFLYEQERSGSRCHGGIGVVVPILLKLGASLPRKKTIL